MLTFIILHICKVQTPIVRSFIAVPLHSQVHAMLRTGLAVSVLHDVHCRLVPPVQHHYSKDVPYLVTRAEVVELSWKVSFWNFRNIEEKCYSSNEIHDNHTWSELLYNSCTNAAVE